MTEPTPVHKLQTATVVKVCPLKVWVEDASNFSGDKCVMVQHDAPGSAPVCYCTFHYDHRHTDNASIHRAAETMAKMLGAADPVEFRPARDPAMRAYDRLAARGATESLLEAIKAWFLSGDADSTTSEPTRAMRRAAARWLESEASQHDAEHHASAPALQRAIASTLRDQSDDSRCK